MGAPVEGSHDWVGTCELVPRRLTDRRGTGVRVVLIGLGFTAVGVLFLAQGKPWPLGVLTVVFFGAAAVVGLVKVISPGVLVVDAEGFAYEQVFGRRWRESWLSAVTDGAAVGP